MKKLLLLSALLALMLLPAAHAVSLTISSFKCNDAVSLSIENGANINCVARIQNNDGSNSASVTTVKLAVSGGWAEQSLYTKSVSTTIPAGGSTDVTFEGIKSTTTGSNLKFSSIDIDGTQHAEEITSASVNSMAIKTVSATTSSSSVSTGSEFTVTPSVSVGGSFNSMSLAISASGCSLKSGESATKNKPEAMPDNTVWSPSPWTLVQGSGASCSITVTASGTTDAVTLTKSKSVSVSNPSYVAPSETTATSSSGGGGGGGGGGANATKNKTANLNQSLSPVEPGKPAGNEVCAQVITPATNPATGECKEFPTPCDVPQGWVKVDSCPSENAATGKEKTSEPQSGTRITWATYLTIVVIIIAAAALYITKRPKV